MPTDPHQHSTSDEVPPSALSRARSEFAAGRAAGAESLLRRNLDRPECLVALREYLVAEDRMPEALELAERHSDAIGDALVHHAAGRFRDAMACCQRELDDRPEYPSALLHLARAAHNLGDPATAMLALRKAVGVAPEFAEGWYALAHALRAGGDLQAACDAYEQALERSPGLTQARLNLGLTRLNMDDAAGALECFNALLIQDPDDTEALIHAGLAQHLLGRLEGARDKFEKALDLAPEHPQAHRYLSAVFNEAGDADQAITHLRRALAAQPDDPELYADLAGIHELSSQLEPMRQALEDGLNLDPAHPRLNLEAARLDRRQGDPAQAARRLKRMDSRMLPPRLAQQYFHELALCMDRLNQPDQVMQALAIANRIKAGDPRTQSVDKAAFFDRIGAIEAWLDQSPSQTPSNEASEGRDLCFLIGFPRSGTTLIDTMLDAHPEVAGIEEKPTLERVVHRLRQSGKGYPHAIDDLSEGDTGQLRSLYRQAVHEYLGDNNAAMIVDKLHLRLLDVGLIQHLFPGARFLFIQRHPCDVVLSNYMQLYEPTEAFIHCDTLEGTVRFFDAVMRLWPRLAERVRKRLIEVRYEDLVANPAPELEQICRFLEITWHPDMVDTESRTRARGRVRTNSYQQVAEDIYQRSAGRWQRYAEYLHPHLDTLRPHAEMMNYEMNPGD